ncbi:autotransporter adhesin BpaC-like [Siniperca chuatsi]|uniref:autotransporter adhesin BpaC-like n=1 Tax=Siniperca chuatsi TaxID=119488 RepID=UPI001CE0D83B|nr:autotransporter adhesin BpaC-like [Siniperca chuatsi]
MGAVRVLLICVLTVWFAKGSCLPVGGTNERRDNGLQRRMRDLSPNEISINNALVLLQSIESILQQEVKEVQLESNEVEATASIGHQKLVQQHLNRLKDLKTEEDGELRSDNATAADNATASREAAAADNATLGAADNATAATENTVIVIIVADNATASADNATASADNATASADNATASADNATASADNATLGATTAADNATASRKAAADNATLGATTAADNNVTLGASRVTAADNVTASRAAAADNATLGATTAADNVTLGVNVTASGAAARAV